jgi:two-component system sensor histidine kinase AlgZ
LTLLIVEPDQSRWFRGLASMLQILEPGLLLGLLFIGAVAPRLTTSSTFRAWAVIFFTAQLGAFVAYWLETRLAALAVPFFRYMMWSVVATAAVGGWLSIRQQARSPALAEARLMALSARIRPHFLFNSLNGILGIIRADPRRAEKALEELAELFRALMQDPRELVPLSEEIALCRQYIELERLRLGDRVRVNWDIEQCPPDALMPPLMLQPLLENAVYHGLEPAVEPGMIEIKLVHTGSSIVIVMSNPHQPGHSRSNGNQMALTNIRERLSLFYDLAASLDAEVNGDRYAVRIVFPYRKRTR